MVLREGVGVAPATVQVQQTPVTSTVHVVEQVGGGGRVGADEGVGRHVSRGVG